LEFISRALIKTVKIHAHHGKGGGATEQGDVRELQAIQRQWPGVQVFVRGHSHKPKFLPFSWYYDSADNPPRIKTGEGFLVNAGSFRQGVIMNKVDYAEKRVYPPTSNLCPFVSLSATYRKENNGHLDIELSAGTTVKL
jgi:hypothetical protein